ncbi:MAG: hypothetical protein GY927_01140, partial [bacterium]|nr:hypothetical protein [bacterium]
MKRRRRNRQKSRQAEETAVPFLDLPRIQPRMTMMTQEDRQRLHHASCQILHNTGVEVFCPAGLDLLRQAGADVSGDLVKIPPSLVEQSLKSAPNSFNLYYRGSDKVALKLDGQHVYFGPGSDTFRYLDPRSGQRRNFTLADIADTIRLCDALPEIGFVMSIGVPRDVPTNLYFRYQCATMLRNTTKPLVVVCTDLADMEAIAHMA